MKISKHLLQEIIKQEMLQLVKEQEIDEGFLDKLLGKGDSKFGEFVTDDEIKRKLNSVQQLLGQLRGLAAKQDNKQLALGITNISSNVADLYKLSTPVGDKQQDTPDSKKYGNINVRSPSRTNVSGPAGVKLEQTENE